MFVSVIASRPGSRVIGIDRSRVDQSVDSRGKARLGNLPGDFDVLIGEFFPGSHIGSCQVVDDPSTCNRLLAILRPGEVSPDDLDLG